MIKINLQDYYPFYQYDCFVDVPEEVAEALQEFDRQENAYQRRMGGGVIPMRVVAAARPGYLRK